MALIEGCKHELEFTVPVDEVERTTADVVADFQQAATLRGFRKGKAPASLIRQRFASDIRSEVLDKILPRVVNAKIQEEDLAVVGRPEVTDLKFELGAPLSFKVTFEVAPKFELEEYLDLAVKYSQPEIGEEEIDKRIDSLRERRAELVNVDPRPLEEGDHAVVSLSSLSGLEGDPIHEEELMVEIGSEDTVAGFSDHLRGMSPGEEKEFEVTYPEDYGQERLAGKTVRFHAKVKGLRKKELPELNDEFAKDLGDYETLEELRTAIRQSIYREKENAAQREAREELVDQLVARHDFPVPDQYVTQQIRHDLERQLALLAAQGIDPKGLNLNWNDLKESRRERAIHEVKASLILGRIAEREGIHATHDEVDAEVDRMAARRRQPAAVVRMELEEHGGLGEIAGQIRTEKTLAFLFERARKEAKEA